MVTATTSYCIKYGLSDHDGIFAFPLLVSRWMLTDNTFRRHLLDSSKAHTT